MPSLDLLVKGARLRGSPTLVNIGVTKGRITFIDERETGSAETVIDAKGNLALPSFVDPHFHLDKAFLGGWAAPASGGYSGADSIIAEQKKNFTVDNVRRRAARAVELAVVNGVSHIRAMVDLDKYAGLMGLKGVLEVKKEYSDIVDMEIVALPGGPVAGDKNGEELLREAMALGADVAGGSPRKEIDDADAKIHIDKVFEIAQQFSKPIDMHIDVTCDPQQRTLHYLAAKTIREGLQGRVTVGHVVALSYYNDYYAEQVISLVKQARINVVTCPATSMYSGAVLDKEPRGRGITRVRQLLQAGVNVAVGQDNIDDAFNPLGDADPLTNGFLTSYAAQLSSDDELETVIDMVTKNGAAILGLTDWSLSPGKAATFNIVNAPTGREALRTRAERLYVIRAGRVIATTTVERRLHR
jgi:cytosine/creatinine deaminase